MPITRKLVAQDQEDSQILKMDSSQRYIVNSSRSDWQMLFGPDSVFSNSVQVVKIAVEFDKLTLNNIRFTAYLYEPRTGSIASAATCNFTVYKVENPSWSESLITSFPGSPLPNSYFFANPSLPVFSTIDFDGGDTIIVEVVLVRLGITYRDRVYINHLGVYDSIFRLKQDIEFLDISKQDL